MFSTAITPLTDGHKQRSRHMGHNQNIIWGPLQTFSTHNFADTYSSLLKTLCNGDFELPHDEEPIMPTLQEMHRMAAASPASTASFWLLKQELAYRHLYGMDAMHIGKLFVPTVPSKYMREDHLASSGVPGLGGFGESSLTPGEAQARGFEHGHDKKTSIPKSHVIQRAVLKRTCEMQRHGLSDIASTAASPRVDEDAATMENVAAERAENSHAIDAMSTYNQQLISYATTRQYESSVLPGRQLGIELPPSPFSALQQRQSKYDGLLEVDETTTRDFVEIVEQEPAAHIAREQRKASAEHRRPLSAYSQIPLTGNSLTLQPS